MSYQDKLQQIDTLQAAIEAHGPLAQDVLNKINYKLRLEWNYTSNSMEGNSLTKQETRSVMIGNITVGGKPIKDVLEMKGHDDLIADILKMGKGEVNISEKRVKEIHKAIVHEEDPAKRRMIGQWKTDSNYVYNYKNERFDFVAPADVSERMHLLINWLNAEREKITRQTPDALHPVMLALQFHLDYVSIHPFYDGNGRTARILTNIILIAYGYPPLYIQEKEKGVYYQYLADIQGYGGRPDLFYEFMADLLLRSLQLVLDAIEGREIEEVGDLDKKLALLKKRLGQSHEAKAEIRYSKETIWQVVERTIIPLAKAWEQRLADFDVLFQFRTNIIMTDSQICIGDPVKETLTAFVDRGFNFLLKKDGTVRKVQLICEFHNLHSIRDQLSIRGELHFSFYDHSYEVTYPQTGLYSIIRLYDQLLTNDEIALIIEKEGTLLYEKIEKALEEKQG